MFSGQSNDEEMEWNPAAALLEGILNCLFEFCPTLKLGKAHLCTDCLEKFRTRLLKVSVLLFNFKKEGNADTCHDMDEPWGHRAKSNKPVTKGQILYGSIYMMPRVVNSQRQSRMAVARAWGGDLSHGYGVSVSQGRTALETGCTSVDVLTMTKLWT